MGKLCGNNEKSGILTNFLGKAIGDEGEKKIIKLMPEQMETLKNMRESIYEEIYEDVSREVYQKTCGIIGEVPYMDVAAEMIENTFQENGINPYVYNETLEKYGLDEMPFTEANMEKFRENCPEMAKMYDDIREINSYCKERYERIFKLGPVDPHDIDGINERVQQINEIEADLEESYPGMNAKHNDAQNDNFKEMFEGDIIFKKLEEKDRIHLNDIGFRPAVESVYRATVHVPGMIGAFINENEDIAVKMTEQLFEDKGVDPYDYMNAMRECGMLNDVNMLGGEDSKFENREACEMQFREQYPEMAAIYDEINAYEAYSIERTYSYISDKMSEISDKYPDIHDRFSKAQNAVIMDMGFKTIQEKDDGSFTMDMKYDMIQEKEDKPFTMDMKYDMDNKPSEATLLKASEGASAIANITAAATGIDMVAQNNTIEKTIEKAADEMVETATQDIDFEPYC